jgi:hypothetical protein
VSFMVIQNQTQSLSGNVPLGDTSEHFPRRNSRWWRRMWDQVTSKTKILGSVLLLTTLLQLSRLNCKQTSKKGRQEVGI